MVQTTSPQTSEDSHGELKPIRLPQVYVGSRIDLVQTYPLEPFHELRSQLHCVLIEAISSVLRTKEQFLLLLGAQHFDRLTIVDVCHIPIRMETFSLLNGYKQTQLDPDIDPTVSLAC
jgi:hypothetical protein